MVVEESRDIRRNVEEDGDIYSKARFKKRKKKKRTSREQ
jgi:hypothetical protein